MTLSAGEAGGNANPALDRPGTVNASRYPSDTWRGMRQLPWAAGAGPQHVPRSAHRAPSSSSRRRSPAGRERPYRLIPHRCPKAVGSPLSALSLFHLRPLGTACPGPGVEIFRIRLDDPACVHRSAFRGVGVIGNPSKRPEGRGNRRALAIRCETEGDNRPGKAAGIQAEDGSSPTPGRRRTQNRVHPRR